MARVTRGFAMDVQWGIMLKDLGMEPADVLRRARLPEDLLHRKDSLLATDEFFRFWRAVEESFEGTAFPLRLAEIARVEAFSPTVFAAMCSADLRSAVLRLAKYKRLVAPMALDIEEEPGSMRLSVRWLEAVEPPPRSLVATEALWFVQLARTATRHRVVPLSVHSPVLLGFEDSYRDYFGCRVELGDRISIRFSDEDAGRPFMTANPMVWEAFEPTLRRRLAELDESATTGERVRGVLLEALPAGNATMDFVSRRLAMSRRTLQRRLREEQTTFQDVLRATRTELAQHYLSRTDLTASEIGFLLGFEETSSFFRAFHAWTGMTPEAARRQGFAAS